jgi:hypothetical protein
MDMMKLLTTVPPCARLLRDFCYEFERLFDILVLSFQLLLFTLLRQSCETIGVSLDVQAIHPEG